MPAIDTSLLQRMSIDTVKLSEQKSVGKVTVEIVAEEGLPLEKLRLWSGAPTGVRVFC